MSGRPDDLVTELETMATRLMPSDVPSWAVVLNTAPARACMSGGKTSVMTRWAMVKRTVWGRDVVREWSWGDGRREGAIVCGAD